MQDVPWDISGGMLAAACSGATGAEYRAEDMEDGFAAAGVKVCVSYGKALMGNVVMEYLQA